MKVLEKIWQNIQTQNNITALEFQEQKWSYLELGQFASSIVKALEKIKSESIGLWVPRHPYASMSAFGIMSSIKAYVPLHPMYPPHRNAYITDRAGLKEIIAPPAMEDEFLTFLEHYKAPLTIYLFDRKKIKEYSEKISQHSFQYIPLTKKIYQLPSYDDFISYILFTSGSTGQPKGVGVLNSNLNAYVNNILSLYPFSKHSKCSQTFDMTFDLSVHDIFVSWAAGANLCLMSYEDLYFPNLYIKNKNITHWFSVPTMAANILKLNILEESSFKSLEVSLFCGEALPLSIVQTWQDLAPSSLIENLYGPTEATIAFTRYRFDKVETEKICRYGLVPIGKAFANQVTFIKNIEDSNWEHSKKGELFLSGSQVAPGYIKDKIKTEKSFVLKNQKYFYKTGDLVEKDDNGVIHFVGRVDFQIKLHGHRIELAEIENVFREITCNELCFCIPCPLVNGVIEGLTLVMQYSPTIEVNEKNNLLEKAKKKLAHYMVPQEIKFFHKLPINSSGKIDRKEIFNLLQKS